MTTTGAVAPALPHVQDRRLVLLAWAATLLVSAFPQIVLHWFGVSAPAWTNLGEVAVVAALAVIARRTRLAGYFVVLVALAAVFAALEGFYGVTGLRHWFAHGPADETVPTQAAFLVLPGAAMVAASLAFGLTRRQLFLTSGDPRAKGRIPGTARRASWTKMAAVSALVALVPLAIELELTTHAHAHAAMHALELLPVGIAFAVVNAVQEEVRFRAVPLAWLAPVLGKEQAIWLTALAFGLAHWNGHPSGPAGVVMTLFFGAWLAKAMLETRGLAVPAAIHAAADAVIYGFLVVGSG